MEVEYCFIILGQDLITHRVALETGGLRESDSVQTKQTSDLDRHTDRCRNANECFGVCSRRRHSVVLAA